MRTNTLNATARTTDRDGAVRLRAIGQWVRYGLAGVVTLAAFALAALVKHSTASETFAFLLAAVAASALFGGVGPGLFAAALSTLGAVSLVAWSPDRGARTVTDLLPLDYFGGVALLVGTLGGVCRRRWEFADAARRQSDDARRLADAVNQARSASLTSVGHELRTPLAAVLGYAELMQLGLRGPVTDQQVEDLRRIHDTGTYLLRLINDLMIAGKTGAQAPPLDLAEVSVEKAIASAVAMITPQANAKRLTVTHLPARATTTVRADRTRLQQILINLAGNAVKFSAPGGSLTLGNALDGENVRIWIRDAGCGISPDRIADIFSPFVRGGASRGAVGPCNPDGIGLGLAISKDLAHAMGGDLAVESVVGVGSTFVLTLPGSNATIGAHHAERLAKQ